MFTTSCLFHSVDLIFSIVFPELSKLSQMCQEQWYVVALLLSVCHFATVWSTLLGLVLLCFVNVNAMASGKDALWWETLLALNNKPFLHLKLLLYMSRFSQPLKGTCTFSLEGNGSEKAIQKSHRVGNHTYFLRWVNNFNWFNHKRITGKLHWFPNP